MLADPVPSLKLGNNLFGDNGCIRGVRDFRKQNHKFIAAIAKCEIDEPAIISQHLTNLGQKLRSGQMPMGVVYSLEMIQIEKHQREFVSITLRAIDFGLQNKVQMPRIVKIRAVVRYGQFMNTLHMPRILQRDGSEVRQCLQERQIAITEAIHIHAVDQLDYAQAVISKTHRNGHNGPCLHLGFLVHFAEKPRVLANVGNDDGLLVLRHPARNALADFNAHVL